MQLPISKEELMWIIMSVEQTIEADEEMLSWYESRGEWDSAEERKARLKRYRDILVKLQNEANKEG